MRARAASGAMVLLWATMALCGANGGMAQAAGGPPLAAGLRSRNTTSDIEKVVTSYFTMQNAGDCNGFVGLLNGTFVIEDPNGSPPQSNKNDVLQGCLGAQGAFKTIALTPTSVFVAGNGAAVAWTCTSVFKNGCKLNFSGIDAFELDMGTVRISEVRGFFDASIPAKQCPQ